jgi:CheY-like chemotaxis protein
LIKLLRQAAHDYQSILADNGVALTVNLPTEHCWLTGDCMRLSQIVANLLHNAGKFTNRGGEVRLSAILNAPKQTVSIKVEDNGIGMSQETLRRVFDAFSQAESALDRSKGGLGLGLALVKGLTELHGGTVKAESDGIGRGSSFTITLPIMPTQARPTDSPTIRDTTVEVTGKRLLLIEDNHDAAHTLQILISRMGFDVDIALSGLDGLDAARRTTPDIVICDIGLPGLDGFAVARALRSDAATSDAFLIAQSGYGQADDVRKALDAGFDLHLIKPVDFNQLQQTLRSASQTTRNPLPT